MSDKLVTCICDVVKKTALKRLAEESCIILGLKCKSCFALSLAHVSSIRTICAKIIDIWGAGKNGYCLRVVFDGQNTHEDDMFFNMIIMCDENRLWQFNSKIKQQS